MERGLDLDQKLALLMSLATDDREGLPSAPAVGVSQPLPPRLRNAGVGGALRPLNIRNVRTGTGEKASLLRILMTNACSFNCHYCPMRRDRSMPRTLLRPDELVRIFLGAWRRGWCSGLFITTGIPGRPVKVMDDLIEALELLREKHHFHGYIHVKIVPGADDTQIERITSLASRVSINFEAPCGASLAEIAPDKSFDVTEGAFEHAREQVLRARAGIADGRPVDPAHPGGTSGMTVQFVVGASSDTDRTLIDNLGKLYSGGGLHHAHFSAFRPIRDTPLEEKPATPALREHRLYQADHLIRRYGFERGDVVYGDDGNLPLELDPKTAAALANPEWFPVEINTAGYSRLLRVPGIGPRGARRIVEERRGTRIRGLADLRAFGVVTSRAAGFLTLGGRRLQTVRWAQQLGFWRAEEEVGAHQLTYEVSPGTFR